jgi:hypothetical protein
MLTTLEKLQFKTFPDNVISAFRNSMYHVEDIDHVISYLRKQADIPVWLIGTSRGPTNYTST